MLFKTPEISAAYPMLHPKLKQLLVEMDAQMKRWGLAEVTITEATRTPDDQERIYYRKFLAEGMSEKAARTKARAKFSWHLCACAVDVRSGAYTQQNRYRIDHWLKEKCRGSFWELLFHDVGLGSHWHIARRDFTWRLKPPKPPVS